MKNKIFLTGASGLLGRAMMREFSQKSYFNLTGVAFKRTNDMLTKLNLLKFDEVRNFLYNLKPEFIIHAAGLRDPNICENDHQTTDDLNINATENLIEIATSLGAGFIYISTDYVFDGRNPPYLPHAQTNPLNYYGKSKLGGEKAVWHGTDDAIVLRIPLLYGQVENITESAVTALCHYLHHKAVTQIDNWAIRHPTLTDDVASVCLQLVEYKLKHPDFKGTFHWSGEEPYTKYEMIKIMGDLFKISTTHILPNSEAPSGVPRPQNCKLDSGDLEKIKIGRRTKFSTAIKKTLEPFLNMKSN